MSPALTRHGVHNEDSLDNYLREISSYPLLTREEEVCLARRIKAGDQEATERLVRANLRFVVTIAKRYQYQGVSLADLINEGNVGLMRAARKFDETRGTKFISYAVWWIRQAILQAIAEQSRVVRVPMSRAGALYRIGKRTTLLLQELGREPTLDEIAGELDVSEEEVQRDLLMAQSPVSLDTPLNPGEDKCLGDYLPDQYSAADEGAYEQALSSTIEMALAGLKQREAEILRLYYGLDGYEPLTLEAIGEKLGITRERVRQIKEKALERLRGSFPGRVLKSFHG